MSVLHQPLVSKCMLFVHKCLGYNGIHYRLPYVVLFYIWFLLLVLLFTTSEKATQLSRVDSDN